MKANSDRVKGFDLRISCDAARQIRQHARASSKAEVCGVLIGTEEESVTSVQASIPGANAVQGGSHVTFTQDTWEHIYRIKDRDYPEARIVGWYHSHPGFGVFLSDHDAFIHKNFFSAPRQVAWVYDPHSDEEGCFGWMGTKLERLSRIVLVDAKGGEGAGETGKPEPLLLGSDDSDADARTELESSPSEAQAMLRAGITVMSYICIMILGFLLCWHFFPRYVAVPVDPRTGQILLIDPSDLNNGSQNGMDGGNLNNQNKPGNPASPLANPTPTPHGSKGKP
jgi:proteasome lid subunit RPN8/RPN11